MKKLNVIRTTLGVWLVGALFLIAVPVNAGTLATPTLIAFIGPHRDWGYSVFVTNLGERTATFYLQCFRENGSPIGVEILEDTLDPGVSSVGYLEWTSVPSWHMARCEIEFQGSASDWRLLLCNYDQQYQGRASDQCIEGR